MNERNEDKKSNAGVSKRIVKLRKNLGMTQEEFAKKLGLTRGSIAKYEGGFNRPTLATLRLIERTFNVSENWILNGEGDMWKDLSREGEILRFATSITKTFTDSFQKDFVLALARLNEEEWQALEDVVVAFNRNLKNKRKY